MDRVRSTFGLVRISWERFTCFGSENSALSMDVPTALRCRSDTCRQMEVASGRSVGVAPFFDRVRIVLE